MGPQGGDDGDDVLQQHAPGDLNAPPVVREARTDDFQIEVSPIHASDDVSAPDGSAQRLAGPSRPAGSPFDARSLTLRRPLAAVSAGAVVVLLIVVLSTLPGAGPTLLRAALGLATPTPTAPLAPGADVVMLIHTVPWGSLSVDGKATAVPAPTRSDFASLPPLARGTHTLVYTADPFPTVRCHLSVPPASSDTCPPSSITFVDSGQGDAPRIIDLQATPNHLPDDQYSALVRAIEAASTVPDGTVQPGDHYLAGTGETMTAPVTLTAHLEAMLPARGTGTETPLGDACDPICADPGLGGLPWVTPAPAPFPRSPWFVGASVTHRWQFSSGDGRVIDTSPVIDPNWSQALTPFQVAWNEGTHAWMVWNAQTGGIQSELCDAAERQSWRVLSAGPVIGQSDACEWGDDPTEGCLIQFSASGAGAAGTSATPSAGTPWRILSRYGVLVAADSGAAHAFPQLPAPSTNERAIVARLLAQH